MFCYPEHIASEMRKLFSELRQANFFRNLPSYGFAAHSAHFLANLNAIHPFREGNGRTQLVFFTVLALKAGHPLNLEALDPEVFLATMVSSFRGEETSLAEVIEDLINE